MSPMEAAALVTASGRAGGGTLLTNGEFRGCVTGARGRGCSASPVPGDFCLK